MPIPLAFMGGDKVNNTIYVAGGQETLAGPATNNFYALDLTNYEWKALKSWPGPERMVPVAAAQSDGNADCFFLFSGRKPTATTTEILPDAYRYNPIQNEWFELSPVNTGDGSPLPVMAGTAIASGSNHILVFGGAK
jgi:N-acetylneuraminic acid mutarotase